MSQLSMVVEIVFFRFGSLQSDLSTVNIAQLPDIYFLKVTITLNNTDRIDLVQ